jgi:glycosyltransferase involved in cell wall biosynthesis
MTRSAPKVSVVLPVYNGARMLDEAVSSVRQQASTPLEIVIVDDGSTDDTPAVAAALGDGVRYVRQEHQGPAAARNAGIRVSRGEFIAFIDADDLWVDRHVAILLAPFEKDARLEVSLGRVQQFVLERSSSGAGEFRSWRAPQFCFHLGAALFRRSAFDRIGGFDHALQTSDDLDWFLRAREDGLPIAMVPETVYCYRLHTTNLTHDADGARLLAARAIKMSLDRRRRRHGECPPLAGIPRMPRPGHAESS